MYSYCFNTSSALICPCVIILKRYYNTIKTCISNIVNMDVYLNHQIKDRQAKAIATGSVVEIRKG